MKRREFLKIAAGAGLVVPSLFGCSPAITSTDQSTGLSLWSLSGDVTDTSAMVWFRAEPGSEVAALRKDPRSYTVLRELGTRPRTTYLARVDDPNPEIA